MESNYTWLPCTIENAGFNSERRFEVELPGAGRVVGVAYIGHLQDGERNAIEDGEPPYGKTVSGFVKCRIIKKESDSVLIEFPGTDVFHVPQDALTNVR